MNVIQTAPDHKKWKLAKFIPEFTLKVLLITGNSLNSFFEFLHQSSYDFQTSFKCQMYVIEFVKNLVFDRKLDLWHTVLALNGYSIVRSVDSSIGML